MSLWQPDYFAAFAGAAGAGAGAGAAAFAGAGALAGAAGATSKKSKNALEAAGRIIKNNESIVKGGQ